MTTYENVESFIDSVAALVNTEPTSCKFRIEILEWGAGPGDRQIIVNADALDDDGKPTVFNAPIVDEVLNDLSDVAEAVCSMLNKAEKHNGHHPVWQVYSEPNWWDKDGDETNDEHNVSTIQYCIFNDNTED